MHDRRGFSLVEAMVAAVVLAVGILAAAATARACLELTTLGDRTARAALVASSRLESLRAIGCASAAGGTATNGAVTETWSATTDGASLAAAITVSFVADGRVRVVRYAGRIACGR